MRISLTAERADALPLLPEIPDYPICRLEGYNGIGKTLSLRILEICTGRQPYRTKSAWDSLRKSLGPVTVVVSGLAGVDDAIEWRFDTTTWDDVGDAVTDDWFDIRIDGRSAQLSEVQSLLSVHRIPGNEGLVGTLSGQVAADSALVKAWSQRFAGREQSPLASTEALLARARELLTPIDGPLVTEFRKQAAEETARADDARTALQAAETHLARIEEAGSLLSRLSELEAAGEDMSSALLELDVELERAEAGVKTIREELTIVEQRAEATEGMRVSLTKARGLQDTRLKRLEGAVEMKAQLLREGEVEDVAQAGTAIPAVRSELQRLLVRRAAVDAGPQMRKLIDGLNQLLSSAESEGLSSQELIATSGVTLSVAETRDAFERRASYLSDTDDSEAGMVLARRIAEGSARLRALEALPDHEGKVQRARELLSEADEQVRELVDAVDEDISKKAEELRTSLREAEENARQTALARASLRRRQELLASGGSAPELRTRLDALLGLLELSETALAEAATEARTTLSAKQIAKETADHREREAKARVDHQERLVADAVMAITDDEEFSWLRYAMKGRTPHPSDPPDRQIELLTLLRDRIDSAADRAGRFANDIDGVWRSLDDLATELKTAQVGPDKGYLSAIRRSLGQRYSDYFNEPAVRTALLQGAESAHINFEEMTVDWQDIHGQRHSRPLEAFSSGEQAFAYTRAMLAGLDFQQPVPARNRLIALDEFGAFVARNRVDALVAMLKTHSTAHEDDRILVVLPLSENYAEQLEANPPSHTKPRLELIARQLREKKYFVEELVG